MGGDEGAARDRPSGNDEAAHAELVRQHGPRMLATARRLLHSWRDARDVVEEAFHHALGEISRLERKDHVETELYRALVEACLRKLRESPGAGEESIEHLLPRFDAGGSHIGPEMQPAPAPAPRLEPNELVRASIEQLPEIYRVVLLLRDVQGLSTEEAARALGIPESAVKMRLHRARQAMLTLLQPHLENSG